MYDLNDTEFEAVLKLNADYREAHCRDKFRTFKELFLLVTDEGPCMLSGDNEEGDEVAVYRQALDLHRLIVVRPAPGHFRLRGNGVAGERDVGDGRILEEHLPEGLPAEAVVVRDAELYYMLPFVAHVETLHIPDLH